MQKFILSALLLGGGALSSCAPATTVPGVTLPQATTPAAAEAPRLLFTPASGTRLTITETSSHERLAGDVQYSGFMAELMSDERRRKSSSSLEQDITETTQSQSTLTIGKVFPDGSRERITEMTDLYTGTPFAGARVRITETVQPGGRVTDGAFESDVPELQAFLDGVAAEFIDDEAEPVVATVPHGLPLIPGHSVTETYSTGEMDQRWSQLFSDQQDLILPLLDPEVASALEDMEHSDAEHTPATITTTSSYEGVDESGNHVFREVTQMSPFSSTVTTTTSKGLTVQFTLAFTQIAPGVTTLVFAPSGLPVSSQGTADTRMTLAWKGWPAEDPGDVGGMTVTFRVKTETTLQAE